MKKKYLTLSFVLVVGFVELASFAMLKLYPFSFDEARLGNMIGDLAKIQKKGLLETDDKLARYYKPHPYFGVVFQKRVWDDSHETNDMGFSISDFKCEYKDTHLTVGAFGGSAIYYSLMDDEKVDFFREKIADASGGKYTKEQIKVYNFALPGGVQPQQFSIFSYFANCLDVAFNFDGWNEMEIAVNNVRSNTPIDFPNLYRFVFGEKLANPDIFYAIMMYKNAILELEKRIKAGLFFNSLEVIVRFGQEYFYKKMELAHVEASKIDFSDFNNGFVSPYKELDYVDISMIGLKKNWFNSLKKQKSIARTYGVRHYTFFQPVLTNKLSRTAEEEAIYEQYFPDQADEGEVNRYKQAFSFLSTLGETFEVIELNKSIPPEMNLFVDPVHFTLEGEQYYLKLIAEHIVKDL